MRKILQSLFGLLPKPKSVVGLLGYFLVALYPVSLVLNVLGNADLVAANVGRIEYVLRQWWGYPLFMILGFALLLYAGYKQQSRQALHGVAHRQPEIQPTTSTSQTDPEDVAQLTTKLADVEKRLESANAVIQGQQKQLSEWDGDRQRFKHFLLEAWSEGTNLRGGNPSKEQAREWEGHVRHLLEQARGEEFADKALRHDPNFQSADFDASDAQKFLEMRLQRVDQLSKNVTKSGAIQFRSGFDPYEWKDWKSPPLTSSADTDSHQIPEHMISERHIRYHERPIRLVDLLAVAGDNGVLRDFQFDHCVLEGPGIINIQGPFPKPEHDEPRAALSVGPTDCRVEGSPDTTLYQIGRDGKMPVGVIHLPGYTLQAVTFRSLGFAGTPEHLAELQKRLKFSEGD